MHYSPAHEEGWHMLGTCQYWCAAWLRPVWVGLTSRGGVLVRDFQGERNLYQCADMSNQADYYLESLITEAFKGKGFQKISEVFEEKIVSSIQRHGKTLLNVLDKLINKELDRNEFKHVSMLMKCVRHFCKNDSQEDSSLIQQGLVSKMVLWFERTLEFLKIWDKTSSFVDELVEEFYDTAVVICRSGNKDGIKQLQDSFLFHLGYVITEKWPTLHIQLEALKTFNNIVDNASREERKSLQTSEEMSALLNNMATKLFEVGDYDGQVAISETLCRMAPRKLRENLVRQWFDPFFANAFLEISEQDFETDCRIFLNCFNLRSKDAIRVYTYPCVNVFADTEKLTGPQDSKLEHFWIDFNIGSNCISFYIQNPKGDLWDSVRLLKHSITGYSLQEAGNEKQLDIYPQTPVLINNKETKIVKIYFEKEHDIESAVIKTYGEELKMIIRNQDDDNDGANQEKDSPPVVGISVESKPQLWPKGQSNSVTEVASSDKLLSPCQPSEMDADANGKDPSFIKSQETLKDFTDVPKPIKVEKKPIVLCRDVRVVLSPVQKKIADDLIKDMKAKYSHTKGYSPKKQRAESSISKFEFPDSSQSGTDIELVTETVKKNSPESSSKRRKSRRTPSKPTRASPSDQKKTAKYTNVVSSESAAETEKSWILEHKKSVDYSRKKSKPKSKLKVLPLSSESSNEDMPKKTGHSSFTVLKQSTQVKGRAESLSFSNVKLPGVSGLLTPEDTIRQSGTVTLSDLDDQDILDPLQEMSSPECAKNSEKENLQSSFSSTIIGKAVTEDDEDESHKKRKRLDSGETELALKPRKLFGSFERVSVRLEEAHRSSSPAEDLTGDSFISSFESFTKQLQTKMMSTYKNMEIQAQEMLSASHTHVSDLISQIQKCKIRKLHHFQEIVAQELSTLEADTQALRELERETLEIWEVQTMKVKQFCVNQSKRLETVLGETQNLLAKNNEQLTEDQESSQKPTKD